MFLLAGREVCRENGWLKQPRDCLGRETVKTDRLTRRLGEKEKKDRAALFPSWQLAAGSKISIFKCLNDLNASKDADILLPYSLTLIKTCLLSASL